jgi:hypothetical protein
MELDNVPGGHVSPHQLVPEQVFTDKGSVVVSLCGSSPHMSHFRYLSIAYLMRARILSYELQILKNRWRAILTANRVHQVLFLVNSVSDIKKREEPLQCVYFLNMPSFAPAVTKKT